MVSRPIIKCGLGSVHKTLIDGGETRAVLGFRGLWPARFVLSNEFG